MKRLLSVAVLVGVAFAGLTPTPADAAYPTEDTPIVFTCTGTGGYADTASGQVWDIESHVVSTPAARLSTCKAWSPDSAQAPTLPAVPGDPTDPVAWIDSALYWAFYQSTWWSPVAAFGNMDFLDLVGDFACGEGTLTKSSLRPRSGFNYANVLLWSIQYWVLEDDFTVTFSDGIGEVSGTVRHEVTDEIRDVSGTIAIDDGAAAGQCDDSAGSANLAVMLVLTPQG